MFNTRERMIFKLELRQCFSVRRIPVFVVLILIDIFLVVQESELSPFIAIFFAVFAILESQFNNILFRSPHELDALSMFPISWHRIVLVKNLATITLAGIVTLIVSITVLYFAPKVFDARIMVDAFVYSSTIIFVLLHVGNVESLRSPRKSNGWQTDDLVQAAGMFLFVLVLSFPYILLSVILDTKLLSLVYTAITAWYWYTRSIPKTAFNIEQKKTELCATI